MKITRNALLAKTREMGIRGVSKKTKREIIHILQTEEGNAPCFGRIPDCGITDCLYRAECV